MNNTAGFGGFTECGQMIPVIFRGESGIFVHSIYLDNEAPTAGGREISVLCAVGSMGYKHVELDPA